MDGRRPYYGNHRRGGGGDGQRQWRPPRPHADGELSVPLWEKRFCTDACRIPWGKLCQTKELLPIYRNIAEWDDSAALEAFDNAKARFWAEYYRQPCNIPLPDPELYTEEVDFDVKIDPELVRDLEKTRVVIPVMNSSAAYGWDPLDPYNMPVPTGWGDSAPTNQSGREGSTNWDVHVDQPIRNTGSENALSTWTLNKGWGSGAAQNDSWGNQQSSSWGRAQDNSASSWKQPNQDSSGNPESNSWSRAQDSSFSNSWRFPNQDSGSRRNGRKRDGAGGGSSSYGPRATKTKYQEGSRPSYDHHSRRNRGERGNLSYAY